MLSYALERAMPRVSMLNESQHGIIISRVKISIKMLNYLYKQ